MNPAFIAMFMNVARYYYNIGGRWSAKTYESIHIIIFRLLAVDGSKACFMRKVYSSIKDSLYSDTINFLKYHNIAYRATVSPLHIVLWNGSEIIFKGADDSEKLKGLSAIDIVLMDEANEFASDDFETIDQSIRGKRQENSIYLCHNPVPQIPGTLFWYQKQFRVKDEPGEVNHYYDDSLGSHVCTMRTTYLQNLKCPEHIKRRLEGYKKTNPDLYKLWAKGLYAEMKGVVLKGWDILKEVPEHADFIGYGLDFGYSVDPAACVAIWGNKKEIWIKALVYDIELSNEQLYSKMVAKGVQPRDRIVCDSSEPKSRDDLFDRGFKGIRGVKKKPNYKEAMANILKGMTIHIIDGDTDLQREMSIWSWDTNKAGDLLPKLKDGDDHYMDAIVMLMHDYRGNREMSVGGF